MPKPFPTRYTEAQSRMKVDRKPFEPEGEPRQIDKKHASPVPAAQVKEFAPVKSVKRDLTTGFSPIEAKQSRDASLKAPNPPIRH